MAPLGFSSRPSLVRHTVQQDPLALEHTLKAGSYISILCAEDKVIARKGPPLTALLSRHDFEMPDDHKEQVLLGDYNDVPVIATLISNEKAEVFAANTSFIVNDLRSLATDMLLPEAELGLLASAKSILTWHNRNRFCANCGHPTSHASSGFRRDCSFCNAQHFPRTDPVVIMLITKGDQCLLGRSPHFPPGRFSCLAGFIEPGETVEAAVRREVFEETGVRVGEVRYLQSQPWPFPSSLMIGMHGIADSSDIVIDEEEIEEAHWFSKEEVRQLFEGNHPEGRSAPPPVAIAHHLLRIFLEN
ncbi:NAD(+) diphosphatase [Microvirga sp. W0021]|uniref:NAD(+) diphosphatase n=1 Tax=Hohaiivirga grylli TaxID=3133970 RepID=A0ABV0BGL8_9HYPH